MVGKFLCLDEKSINKEKLAMKKIYTDEQIVSFIREAEKSEAGDCRVLSAAGL
jgi:hypothetical protein